MKPNTRLAALLLAGLSLFLGCATVPSSDVPSAVVSIVPRATLKSLFGPNYLVNPYLEPTSLVARQPNEFVVLRCELSLPQNAKVLISAKVMTPEGVDVATQYERDDFLQYLTLWKAGDANDAKRENIVSRTYAPSSSFDARRGAREYYVVLLGKNPIPRPSLVSGLVVIEGLAPIMFEESLPENPVK